MVKDKERDKVCVREREARGRKGILEQFLSSQKLEMANFVQTASLM